MTAAIKSKWCNCQVKEIKIYWDNPLLYIKGF